MTGRPLVAGFTSFLLAVSTPSVTRAQGWTLDAYAGRAIYDPVSARVGASNGVLGLRYRGARGEWLYASVAAPFAAGDPLWGATGLGRRFTRARGRFSAGLDLGAHAHGFRDPSTSDLGAGATLEALPFVAVARGPATLELRSGLLRYVGAFSGDSESRSVHDSGARLTLRASSRVSLSGEARYVRAGEGDYAYAGASASADHGRGEIWGSAGGWFSDALPGSSWSAGASFDMDDRHEVWAAIRQDPPDPLYWNDSRRSWNLGVSRRLGRPRAAPAPAPVPVVRAAGRVTIRIPLSEAEAAPFVAGDFNGWKPVAMTRSGGFWTVTLAVKPGFYHYAFRTADGEWFVPESVPGRRADGFGGVVAVLAVP